MLSYYLTNLIRKQCDGEFSRLKDVHQFLDQRIVRLENNVGLETDVGALLLGCDVDGEILVTLQRERERESLRPGIVYLRTSIIAFMEYPHGSKTNESIVDPGIRSAMPVA